MGNTYRDQAPAAPRQPEQHALLLERVQSVSQTRWYGIETSRERSRVVFTVSVLVIVRSVGSSGSSAVATNDVRTRVSGTVRVDVVTAITRTVVTTHATAFPVVIPAINTHQKRGRRYQPPARTDPPVRPRRIVRVYQPLSFQVKHDLLVLC